MAVDVKKMRTAEARSNGSGKGGFSTVVLLSVALLLALSAGALTGVLASYYLNNSRYSVEVSALATYRPPQVTTIYADDGETILAEFALEKRIPIKIQDVPDKVTDALLAIEDYRFRDHIGIDPYRIVGAVVKNLTTGKVEGASTITQQLAKNLFLYKDQTYTRKVNEWAVALQIERLYTKDQILEMYMNYVFLGAGAYGFEAGSRTYFGKSVKDLNLEEAALLAAVPKSPEYSPTRSMDKARIRRDIVLDQMAKYFPSKYSQAEVDAAKAKPIVLADTAYYQSQPKSTAWDYPVEDIRKYLEEKYTTRVAQGGLKVYTTINVEAQKIATQGIRQRLREYDRGRKWRSDYPNILINEDTDQPFTDQKEIDKTLNSFKHADWYGDDYKEGEYIKGLVMKAGTTADEVGVRFGRFKAIVRAANMGRSGKRPREELKPGFLAEFLVKAVDREHQTLDVELMQVPDVQAAMQHELAPVDLQQGLVGDDLHGTGIERGALIERLACIGLAVAWGELQPGQHQLCRGGGQRPLEAVNLRTAVAALFDVKHQRVLGQLTVQPRAQPQPAAHAAHGGKSCQDQEYSLQFLHKGRRV